MISVLLNVRRAMKIAFTLPVLSGTDGLVGYDARLTRERSPVRTRGGSITNNADLIRVFTPSEVVTDPAVLTEDAGSHRKGRYEWVPASVADEREGPTVGLPRIKFVGESF